MSVLSQQADGVGYHYGFRPGDMRRIDARPRGRDWEVFVAGELVGRASDKEHAEMCALTWMKKNPDPLAVDLLDD